MGFKLCIAEKRSVGEDIARVIGATDRSNKGYIEGNGYIVTWAKGHLVGLAEPEEYGYVSQADMYDKDKPEMAKKALAELPLSPQEYKLVVLKDGAEQFNIVKRLMHRADVDLIIDCGDAGPEGHILQWFIREKAECKKPVKRFIATDMTDSAIKNAMANLQPIDKYKMVIAGEYCKHKADWVLGMSVSRAASLTYNASIHAGRVMSPTLYFVVERYLSHERFKPQTFYTLECEFDGFALRFQRDTENVLPKEYKDESGRIINEAFAKRLMSEVNGMTGEITVLQTKKKKQERPQLYNTETLAKDCIRIYGYTGSEVAEITEKLYHEYKILTYPRTDSQYITTDLAPHMEQRIKDISVIENGKYSVYANADLSEGLTLDKRIVDDGKVDDHHAIITTGDLPKFDLSKLKDKERNILHLVIVRMLAAFSQPYKYQETSIAVKFPNGLVFTSTVKVPDDLGFKAITDKLIPKQSNDDNEENSNNQNVDREKAKVFSSLSVGQQLKPMTVCMNTGSTTAPPLLTEADLIDLMAHAGDKLGEQGKIMKGKGIGTQATKLETIKKLFEKKYIEYKGKGKVKNIIPTQTGINVIKVLPHMIYSPALTAEWENKIEQIRERSMTEQEFMSDFFTFIKGAVDEVKSMKEKGIDFSNSLCSCPICKKGKVLMTEKTATGKDGKERKYTSFWCSLNTEKTCTFGIRNDNPYYRSIFGHNITKAQILKIIEKGSFTTKTDKGKVTFKLDRIKEGKFKGYYTIEPDFAKKK